MTDEPNQTAKTAIREGQPAVGSVGSRYAVLQQAQTGTSAKEQISPAVVVKVGKSQPSEVVAKQNSQQIFLEGYAQVPVVSAKMPDTTELSGKTPDNPAGALPHAPDPPQRERRKRKDTKGSILNVRMTSDMRNKLDAKAAAVENYPSTHVLELSAAGLCLPIDGL
jgi:hypothetical protein